MKRVIRNWFFGVLSLAILAGSVYVAHYSLTNINVPTAGERLGYVLSEVRDARRNVPRVYFKSLPSELVSVNSAKQRKDLFVQIMLPLILQINDRIGADRERLMVLRNQIEGGIELRDRDIRWLSDLAAEYNVKPDHLDELMGRVNIVPPSLAIAQAAIESGWGTSRFAQQGNAIFGQWTWGGEGIIPQRREAGQTHKVKSFNKLLESVAAYVRNLNTHYQYTEFRTERERMDSRGAPIDGGALAETLGSYSGRGLDYIRELQTIMRTNRLSDFDRSALESPA